MVRQGKVLLCEVLRQESKKGITDTQRQHGADDHRYAVKQAVNAVVVFGHYPNQQNVDCCAEYLRENPVDRSIGECFPYPLYVSKVIFFARHQDTSEPFWSSVSDKVLSK